MNQDPWRILGWLLVLILAVVFGPLLLLASFVVLAGPAVILMGIVMAMLTAIFEAPIIMVGVVAILITLYATLVWAARRRANLRSKSPPPLSVSVDEFVAELRRRAKRPQ